MAVINGNASNNRLTGTSGADSIYGHAGNDTLFGGEGRDYLYGGSGADSMVGGTGNDVYMVGEAGDRIQELAGQGTDEVRAWIDWTLGANLENLILFDMARNGTGNDLNNGMWGNDQSNRLDGGGGNDSLFGGSGVDTLIGGAGNDTLDSGEGATGETLDGGTGNDTYIVWHENVWIKDSGGYDVVMIHQNFYTTPWDVEEARLVNGGTLWGNEQNNILVGSANDDTIDGELVARARQNVMYVERHDLSGAGH